MPERKLPEVLARVAERRGLTAALRLAYWYGGQEIYIPYPKRLVAGHHLVDNLGAALALAVCEIFGRGALRIPIGPLRQSPRAIGALPRRLRHATASRIAAELGVHIRTAEHMRARARRIRGAPAPGGRA